MILWILCRGLEVPATPIGGGNCETHQGMHVLREAYEF